MDYPAEVTTPESVDRDEIRIGSSDPRELQGLLNQLVDRPFLWFRKSYGNELKLHLGESIPALKRRSTRGDRGSFVVATRASVWMLYSAGRGSLQVGGGEFPDGAPIAGSQVGPIEGDRSILPGTKLVRARAETFGGGSMLRVDFQDGSSLLITPWPGSRQPDPGSGAVGRSTISDWEILMPHARILKAGPGDRWSYLDSRSRSDAVPSPFES